MYTITLSHYSLLFHLLNLVNGSISDVVQWAQKHFQRFSSLQIPVTYPATAPEIALPELDGKTAKMYRGGKICLTDHFKPLWARNVPKFGIAHAMALGVSLIKCNLPVSLKLVSGLLHYVLFFLFSPSLGHGWLWKFPIWLKRE